MEELFNSGYEWLSEEEKDELAMYIGMVELGRDVSSFNPRPIVMVAYNFYILVKNPEYVNFS